MIKAIALDDEPLALKIIENFCRNNPEVELVKSFTSTTETLNYLKTEDVDLIFLDINMPSISGIVLSRQLSIPMMVVFTTAYSEYAVEGFNVNAVDFLLKPFTLERFNQAIAKATEKKKSATDERERHILIKADYTLYKVNLKEILLIEGLDDYLKIFLEGKKPIVARFTMKGIMEKLPPAEFVRIHRSFIVPFSRITGVSNKKVLIPERELPIGKTYEDEFMQVFQRKL